mgnify:CR=1 FL=1
MAAGKRPGDGAIYAGHWAIGADDPEREAANVAPHVLYQTNAYIGWGAFGPPETTPLFPDGRAAIEGGLYVLWDPETAVRELTAMLKAWPQIRDVHFWAKFPGESFDSGWARVELLMNRVLPGQEAGKGFDRGSVDSPPLKQARVVDFDLDGWPDIVGLSTIGRPVLLHNDRAGKLVHVPEALGADIDWPADLIAVTTFDLDGDDQPDVLAWSATKGLIARRSLGNGNSAVKVRLVGRRDSDRPPAERSNNDGTQGYRSRASWRCVSNMTFQPMLPVPQPVLIWNMMIFSRPGKSAYRAFRSSRKSA